MLGPGGEPGDDNLYFPACKQDGGDGSSIIDFMGPGTDGDDGFLYLFPCALVAGGVVVPILLFWSASSA